MSGHVGLSTVLAIVLWGPAVASAAAQSSFQGSITNFQIEVVDLDLNDGVEAGYVFARPRVTVGTDASTFGGSDTKLEIYENPGDAQVRTELGGATASGRFSNGSFFVQGAGPGSTHAFGLADELFQSVNVLPNTRLTFEADVSVSTSGVAALGAWFELKPAFGSAAPGTGYEIVAGSGESKSEHASFSFDWTGVEPNSGENVWAGDFRIGLLGEIEIVDEPPPAPIPEPRTVALMLVGLAAVGAVVRRRRAG